jgi:HK97 family phage portal protein
MDLISLNIPRPELPEKRDAGVNLNQAGVSLAAGLAALGMGTFTDSNETVNERTAFEVPTYLTCVRVLSESIGSLPLRVYEKLERGQRPAPSHYLYYLLSERPNPQMSATVFFQTLMTAAVGWSNAYAKIERDSSGFRPVALWPLCPWKTKPVRKNGILGFETTDTADGLPAIIKSEDMIHIVGFSFNGLQGTPLVHMARQCMGLAIVAARFGARFYANGARNSFFLQADHDLSPEELTEMRLDVEALSTGANAWRVANLPNGVNIVPVETDENALAEYTTTSKYTRDEIAAFCRVPGYMVGSTEKVMKSTIEAQNREFLTYSLQPWITKIQQELQYKLLPTMGRSANQYVLRFYLDALLAADTLTQTAKQTAGRMGGWLSVNDVREQLGMEPIPGGDEYIVPLNYQAATEASVPEETDDDPEDTSPDEQADADASDPDAKATKQAKEIIAQALKPPVVPQPRSMFLPLFNDAYGRLQNRAKKDSAAVTQTFTPICTAVGNYFRSGSTVGAAETKAIEKYLTGLETRISKTTPDAEFKKLLRCIVYAIEEDHAEARANHHLEGLEHE